MLFSFLFWYANIKRARGPAKTGTIKLWQSVVQDSVYPYYVKYINLIVNKLNRLFKLFNYRVEFSIPGIGRRIRFNKKGARKLLYFLCLCSRTPEGHRGDHRIAPTAYPDRTVHIFILFQIILKGQQQTLGMLRCQNDP